MAPFQVSVPPTQKRTQSPGMHCVFRGLPPVFDYADGVPWPETLEKARIAFQSQALVRQAVCDAVAADWGPNSDFDIGPKTAYGPEAVLGKAVEPQAGGCPDQ